MASTTTTSSNSCQTVAGVWSRLFEEDPIGDDATADKTTLVLWTQTPKSGIYVDIRLPKDSPGRKDTTGSQRVLTPSALRATTACADSLKHYNRDVLTRQKSFAGILTYSIGDTSNPSGVALAKDTELHKIAQDPNTALPLCTCFWKRDIDYQPPSGGLDIGICASYTPLLKDGSVDLRETGDDGSYAEGWNRIGETFQGPFLALELVSENGYPRTGYWVRTGNRFAYAVGRPSSKEHAQALGCSPTSATVQEQVGKSLEEVVRACPTEQEQLQVLVSYVAVTGQVEEETNAWCIENSNNPGLVGCYLVGQGDNSCSVLKATSKDVKEGDVIEQIVYGEGNFVRQWKVVERSGCSLPC